MIDEVQSLRRRIARTPVNGRGYRQYGDELRRDVCSYAAERNAQGESHKEIASVLGLPSATLSHWLDKAPSSSKPKKQTVGFRPVALQANRFDATVLRAENLDQGTRITQPVVVLPGGVRIEGLAVSDLAELVRSYRCLS